MKRSRIVAAGLVATLTLSMGLMSSCGGDTGGTIIEGSSKLNGVFSNFFATTLFDRQIADKTGALLIENDREGVPTDGLATYVAPQEIKNAAGVTEKSVYTFTLKDGVLFSDGTPVTADDIIFTYKVLCDPTYSGSSTLFTTPIVGVSEYRYDDPNYAPKIKEIKAMSENVTPEDITAYIKETVAADMASVKIDDIIASIGYTNTDNLSGDALTKAVEAAYIASETAAGGHEADASEAKYKRLESEYIQANLASGTANVPEIEGIKKIDDKTVEVTIEGVDPKAIWNLGGIMVAPKAYYGVGEDGTEFKKGNLAVVEEKNGHPMGAGPYVFEEFKNNIVSYVANENYYKGAPLTKKYRVLVADSKTHIDATALESIDIGEPSASLEGVQQATDAGLHQELTDNLGYGYVGLNAERIPDINVRKGLMSLMNRQPAVETYYGTELASVIERPMSKTSWAYPKDAKAVYNYSPAEALKYFQAAGYTQVDKNGTKVLEKDGKQLRIEIGIGGEGSMAHPAAPILTTMKSDMANMGALLEIQDVDTTILFDKMNAGTWDMWVAAWSADIDPDMYQVYSSNGPSNHYKLKNEKLDKLVLDGRSTTDIEKRKAIYSEALDIVMDEAVEMPIYQRKNMFVFNPERINIDSLTDEMSPYYTFRNEYNLMEAK